MPKIPPKNLTTQANDVQNSDHESVLTEILTQDQFEQKIKILRSKKFQIKNNGEAEYLGILSL